MNAEIKAVELTKTKAGANAVRIALLTTDNEWVRDFIGEAAPSFIPARYWSLLDISRGWSAFASEEAYNLIGLKVEITTEDGDYGPKVTDIKKETVELPDDDIPF